MSLQIENVPIGSLTPYERNSRTHSPGQIQQLCDSITEFGFTLPLLIDEHSMVLAGHGRLMAAAKLGMTEVPVIRNTNLNEVQKRAYVLADNKLALNSGWDQDVLRLELADLADLSEGQFSLEVTGFDFRELDALEVFSDPGTTELVTLGGGDPGKNKAKVVHSVVSFADYRISASPQEMAGLEQALKRYESTYGLHQGFIGWLAEGRNA